MKVVVGDDTDHLTIGNTLADCLGQTEVEAQARRVGIPATDGGENDAVGDFALLLVCSKLDGAACMLALL